MDKPILSPDFTVEDIHKLREYNYYQTKNMTPQERIDYYNSRGLEVHRKIQINCWLDLVHNLIPFFLLIPACQEQYHLIEITY